MNQAAALLDQVSADQGQVSVTAVAGARDLFNFSRKYLHQVRLICNLEKWNSKKINSTLYVLRRSLKHKMRITILAKKRDTCLEGSCFLTRCHAFLPLLYIRLDRSSVGWVWRLDWEGDLGHLESRCVWQSTLCNASSCEVSVVSSVPAGSYPSALVNTFLTF